MAYRRSNSDTFKLRRLISSLKDSGSELGDHLEGQAGQFFGGVHIVRSKNPLRQEVKYDSDEEEVENDFVNHTNYIRKQKDEHENARIDEVNQRKSQEWCINGNSEKGIIIKEEIVIDNPSTVVNEKAEQKDNAELEKIRQTKEYIDNLLNKDRLALEAENLRKKKKREDELRKLDDKIKKEQEEKQRQLLETKNKELDIEKKKREEDLRKHNEKIKKEQEEKQRQFLETKKRNLDIENKKREDDLRKHNEKIKQEQEEKQRQLLEKNKRLNDKIKMKKEQKNHKDEKAERDKQLLVDEIARKQAEEEYAKLKKEREEERNARARREEERMKLLQKINEEREQKQKEAEEEKRLKDLESKKLIKYIEEEEEESTTNNDTINVDLSAEEERLRLAEERIKELEYSISSLDWKLERFDIEKMNEKTNNVKKRMSIVMGEDAVIEYFQKECLVKT